MTKQKNNNKPSDSKPFFNLDDEIKKLQIPEMLKAGLKSYIIRNEINIKNIEELEKILKKYKEVKL